MYFFQGVILLNQQAVDDSVLMPSLCHKCSVAADSLHRRVVTGSDITTYKVVLFYLIMVIY